MRRFWLLLGLWAIVSLPAGADSLPIVLRSYQFDPLVSTPQVPSDLRAAAAPLGTRGYYIVQCNGPIAEAWKAQIGQAGGATLGYIPTFAFQVRMTPEAAGAVSLLPFVRWVGRVEPAYKAEQSLLQSQAPVTVRIRLHQGENVEAVASVVRAMGGQVLAKGGAAVGLIRARVAPPVVPAIMRIAAVAWVEKWTRPQLYNNVARRIMEVSFLPGAVSGGYDVWKNKGLFGAGQIVCVADTGLDSGDYGTLNSEFAGRVIDAFTYSPDGLWEDTYGHGTHVAGSVLGNGSNSGSIPNAQSYTTSYAGVAPEAQLVVQRIFDGEDWFPSDIYEFFDQAYQSGARIHTNSWGTRMEPGRYNAWSESVDRFSWDHKDMVILFAAGNDGADERAPQGKIDYGSVGPPATAKNCVSVGASESQRPEGNDEWRFWGSYGPPIAGDLTADNPNGLAAFSSRGPCLDGRTKPEIVAPGTWVLSVASAMAPCESAGYCPLYQLMSGTSMATPLTAGSAALIREYFQKVHGRSNPSGALIKATLMNCAFEMTPGQYPPRLEGDEVVMEIEPRPNNDEGWGRVDVGACIFDKPTERGIWYREGESTQGLFTRDDPGINTGTLREWWFFVADQTHPFRATAVWTDYPGFVGSGVQLVNDLDMEVLAPVWSQALQKNIMVDYFGSGSRAAIPEDSERDRINNAEEVSIERPTVGWHRVRVRGYNVPFGAQPFALVVSGSMVNAFSIRGQILDTEGWPVPGVEILITGNTGVLRKVVTSLPDPMNDDPGGLYDIGGLSPGTYTVTPVPRPGAPRFEPQSVTVRLPTTDGDAEDIDFQEVLGFTIDGWVRTPSSQGISQVTVTARSGSLRATSLTNAEGYFQIGNLPAGFWTVTCARTGWSFEPSSRSGFLASPDFTRVRASFTGGSPYPLYTIWGGVKTKTQRTLSGVRFDFAGSIYGNVGYVQSDSGGQYAKGGLRADVYTLTATKPGFLVHPIIDQNVAYGTNQAWAYVSPWNNMLNWLAEDRGLAIISMTVDPAPRVGRTSVVSATIKNMSRAQETNLRVQATANLAPIGATQTIASLAGLTTTTVSFNWVPSSPITYNVIVRVDPIAAEPYTVDNSRKLVVTAQP